MLYLGIFLIAYGAILLVGFLLKFPILYTNMKSKALIKMMGKKGFDALVIILGLATFIIGLYLVGAF